MGGLGSVCPLGCRHYILWTQVAGLRAVIGDIMILQCATTIDDQNHHSCRWPVISIQGFLQNDGFGSQWYGIILPD